jgi:hypothetical protein
MNEANPYAAPAFDPINPEILGRRAFANLDTKVLKQLRNDSHSIRTMAVLILLGVLFVLAWVAVAIAGSDVGSLGLGSSKLLIQGIILLFNLTTLVGLWKRTGWGRVLGFITAGIMLVGFPIGTLIGTLCLISLARGGRLFGPERLLHKELETEWKYRKKNKIA